MSDKIKRVTGLLVIEVVSSNPNGDPDRESDPRQRPNELGEISPVSFKRKLRDLLEDHTSPFFAELPEKYKEEPDQYWSNSNPDRYKIAESRNNLPKTLQGEMVTIIDNSGKEKKRTTATFVHEDFLASEFVRKYWDARVFGNTYLESGGAKGFIKTGVVQFGMGISISKIRIGRNSQSRKMATQEGKQSGMAPLAFRIVEHGVYTMPFFINPNYARKTGCTAADIELLKFLIPHAYRENPSTIRTQVYIRHAWWIEHKNILGSCPDYLLLEALTPKRKGNIQDPSTSYSDYEDVSGLPDALNAKIESCTDLISQ